MAPPTIDMIWADAANLVFSPRFRRLIAKMKGNIMDMNSQQNGSTFQEKCLMSAITSKIITQLAMPYNESRMWGLITLVIAAPVKRPVAYLIKFPHCTQLVDN